MTAALHCSDSEYLDALARLMSACLDTHPHGRVRAGEVIFTLEPSGESRRIHTRRDRSGRVLLSLAGDREGLRSLFAGELEANLRAGRVRIEAADATFVSILVGTGRSSVEIRGSS